MSNNNHIDDVFKKGLANYSEEPPDGMWEKISQKNNDRKPFITGFLTKIIVFSAIVMFVAVSAISYLIFKAKEAREETIVQQSEKPLSNNLAESETTLSPITPTQETITQAIFEKTPAGETTVPTHITQVSTTAETAEKDNFFGHKKPNILIEDPIGDLSELENEHTIEHATTTIDKPTEQEVSADVSEIISVGNHVSEKDEKVDVPLSDKPIELPKTKNLDKKGSFHLGVYASASHVTKSMRTNNQEYADFINWRHSNEKPLILSDFGLLLNYQNSAFIIQTGIGRMTLGEKNNYYYNAIGAIDTSNSFYDYFINTYPDPNNPNNTIIVNDSVWVLVSDTVFQNTVNNHKNILTYISLPLNIGYKIQKGKHGIGLLTGITFSYLTAQNVSYPQINKNDFIFTETAGTPYRKNILSFDAAIAYTYNLNHFTGIFIQPHFRQSITNIYINNNPVNKKYKQFGAMFGVYYNFK